MNAQPRAASISMRRHLLVQFALLAAAFAFYSAALDNDFWHAEDFRFLSEAKKIADNPGELLRLDAAERHHPVPLAMFALEVKLFGFEPRGYYVVNLLIHGLNACLVYWLVLAFLPDLRIAILSGALFAFGVGSYGKAVLFAGGLENLLITSLYLAILNLYIRNDRWQSGRVMSWSYLAVLLLFLVTTYAKATAFSLIVGLMAYKAFFRDERDGRRVFTPNLVILILGALGFWVLRELTGVVDFSQAMAGQDPWAFTRNYTHNFLNYLIHMFFPIHVSRLVEAGHPIVRSIYAMAPVLRVIIGLFAVSYAIFGFVFGNRTIRFFLAYTFISLLPYCAFQFPEDWLNIRYLYQVAIGFCFIMASGTVLSMDLLHRRRWRRFLPFVVPLAFVGLSAFITERLDVKYERESRSQQSRENLQILLDGGDPTAISGP